MSEEIHLTPEELEKINKALENFGSKMQALVNIAKIPEGIIAFFESPSSDFYLLSACYSSARGCREVF